MLVKSTGSSVYDGVFTLLNTSYSGRPVFQHDRRRSLHLFYSQQAGCGAAAAADGGDGAWVVADGLLGSTSSTSMFAADDALDPMLLSPDTTWFVYDRTTDQFLPDTQLTLACYVVSAPTDSQR